MIKTLTIGLLAGHAAAAPAVEDVETVARQERLEKIIENLDPFNETTTGSRRELFALYSVGNKCARLCGSRDRAIKEITAANPMINMCDATGTKGPVKALEKLALNDDLNTVVQSNDFCTRRHAMARAAGLAAGLALGQVSAPGFAAETKTVKMGSDSGQLVFVPDEIKICKGDSITWINNKGGPHNVVFDEEAVPSGVDTEKISMDDQLGDEGATFTMKLDVAGTYSYYCEPHRGAGMNAQVIVE